MDTSPTNRGIEDRLRAYVARRRRQIGEPFLLPPDTKRTLHAEVERKYQRKASPAAHASAWLAWLRLKPVWLTATAVLFLGVAAFLVRLSWGPQTVRELARTEPKEPPLKAVSPPALTDSMLTGLQSTEVSAAAAENRQLTASKADRSFTITQGVAATVSTQRPSSVSQRFVQMLASQDKRNQVSPSQQAPIILQDFQIEVADGKLRMVDSDGSVYEAALASAAQLAAAPTGQIAFRYLRQPAANATVGAPSAPTDSAPAAGAFDLRARMQTEKGLPSRQSAAAEAVNSNAIPFLALGTNRTLNQRVAVQGEIVLPQELGQQIQRQSNLVAGDSPTLKVLLQNATVQARVMIDATNQFELNAAPR